MASRPGRGGVFAVIESVKLLDVEDELYELAGALAWVPEMRVFAGVMDEIITPPPLEGIDGSRDRIARLVHELPKFKRDAAGDTLSEEALTLPGHVGEAELMDLKSAIDTIIAVVEFRIRRLSALMAVL